MAVLIPVGGTDAKDRRGDAIFVHGLDGDARSTWEFRGQTNTFWPEWLQRDLRGVAVWSLDYDAASLAWKGTAMPLVDRATNVLDLFETRGIGSKPLVFIAHSLGGLLVKQLLRQAQEYNNPAWKPLARNTRGIAFFATPHAGSTATGWIEAFRVLLRPNDTIEDLVAHAPQLRDLNTWYRNNAAPMHIETKVYRENQKYKGVMIVDPTSADPGITGVFPVALDFDHVGICKLQDQDQRYAGILNFVRANLKVGPPDPGASSPSTDILQGLPTKWAAQVDAFLLQYLGTPGSRAPFGGREKHLQALTAWLRDKSPQYGLIAVRAGLGKSALLAHWVEALQEDPAGYSLVYFPISARWQTNSESAVFASLAFRLAHLFGEPAPQTEDVRELREVMRQYMSRAVDGSRRLLLIVDGLDEAGGWEVGTDFLPPRSRGNVRVVVAARPLGQGSRSWLGRLGWNLPGVARPFPLDELDRDGVADVLRQMGNPLLPLGDQLDVVETLFAKSRGDPLLVGLYVNELKQYAANSHTLDKQNFDAIEPGLGGFFQFWFEDQARLWGDNRHEREPAVRGLLSICSLAHGPLLQEDVQGLYPDLFPRRPSVEAAAKDLERLIMGDGRRQGYVFSHPRLGEFVREEMLDEPEVWDCRERFLRYGTATVEEMTQANRKGLPEYVVRWHSTHLTESGPAGEQFLPLLDVRWCAEWERVDGTPAGFLSDLEKAWQASRPNEVGVRIRLCLLRCSILAQGRIDEALFGQCVASGVISATLAEVMARQQATAELRCRYWLALVSATADGRLRFLREALTAARQIANGYSRAGELSAVAERLGPEDSELLREALAAARQIADDYPRAIVLSAMATRVGAEDGEKALQEALVAARRVADEDSRAKALSAVAARLGPEDREKALQEAFVAARQSAGTDSRARALCAVGARLGSEDRKMALQEALAAARQTPYAGDRARALSEVAEHLDAEDLELLQGALAAARQNAGEEFQSMALSAVAARLGPEDREKALQEALAAARQIVREDKRARALSEVADGLSGEDREKVLQEALAAARQIPDEGDRAIPLSEVAERLRLEDRKKALEEALAAARRIANKDSLATVLRTVAERLDSEDRKKALQEALAAARRIADVDARARALSAVAARLGPEDREKSSQEALAAARQIANEYSRASALTAVAESTRAEDRKKALQEALVAARQITYEADRVSQLREVAKRLSAEDRELLQMALAAAREIEGGDYRVSAMIAVAERLGLEDREKALQEALAAARQTTHEGDRASALSAVAERLRLEDRGKVLQEALAAAKQTTYVPDRARALSVVAERLDAEDRELLQEALAAARQIEYEEFRSMALSAVAARLGPEDRENTLQELLVAARRIEREDKRARALSELAEGLGVEDREKALQEALEAARQIEREDTRASVLTTMAAHLGPEDRRKALQEALAAARQIANEHFRASALTDLAEGLRVEDRELLQETLAAAREIEYDDDRARALSAVARYIALPGLVELLQSLPELLDRPEMLPAIERVAGVWGEFCRLQEAAPADVFNSWLLRLARNNRSHVTDVLRLLVPVIEAIGGTAALKDMGFAIAAAGHWWP